MRRVAYAPTAVLVACAALAAAGCSSGEDEAASAAPAACLAGSDAYLVALRAAPGEVLLEGETPISDCLTPEQEGGQLADDRQGDDRRRDGAERRSAARTPAAPRRCSSAIWSARWSGARRGSTPTWCAA